MVITMAIDIRQTTTFSKAYLFKEELGEEFSKKVIIILVSFIISLTIFIIVNNIFYFNKYIEISIIQSKTIGNVVFYSSIIVYLTLTRIFLQIIKKIYYN